MERRPDGDPVTSVEQALALLGHPHETADAPEGDIRERPDETHVIVIGEVSGWPEVVTWQQEFPLKPEVFKELRQKEYIKKATPISWGIATAGIAYMREYLGKGTV